MNRAERYSKASKVKNTLASAIMSALEIKLSFVVPSFNGPYEGLLHSTPLTIGEAIRIADLDDSLSEVGELAYGLRGGFWVYEYKTLTITAR